MTAQSPEPAPWTPQVWVDDRLVAAGDAHISVADHAFTVGDAVFETMKVKAGTPFALTRHLQRLVASAGGLGLGRPDDERLRAALAAVLAQPGLPATARVRITYGAGAAPMGSGRGDAPPRLVVTVAEATPWPPTTSVVTVPWVRNERSAVAGLKTTSYAENVVALEHAHARGAGEAIFANTRGELCEGTGSNIFVVLHGALCTPPLASGCLPGVTRDLVIAWSRAVERNLTMEELARADEVFLTSSTRDVQAVAKVDERALPDAPGPVTRAAAADFARRSREDSDP